MSVENLKDLISKVRSYNLPESLISLQQETKSNKILQEFLAFSNNVSKLNEQLRPHVRSLREKEMSDVAKKMLDQQKSQ